jgi:activator of HSP90 ATPase
MKTFKKTFKINAEPSDIYSALTNSYTIELWSGYPAKMSEEPGSDFSLWDGDITGKNLEFIKDKRVMQEWFFGDSQVTVEHSNIPDEDFDDIAEGWREYYIGAIMNFFNPNF